MSELPKRPQVAVNFAMTWDARISTKNQTPSDFSSRRDKHRLLEIRASGDAILAGMNTVRVDKMRMGISDDALRAERVARGTTPSPLRVLVSNSGQIDATLPVFQVDFAPVLIFSTQRMPHEAREALGKLAFVTLHLTEEPEVNLPALLTTLKTCYGVERVICEGGPTLFRTLAAQSLVDELNLTLCPRVFSGVAAPTLTGGPGAFLSPAQKYRLKTWEVIDGECFTCYEVARG